MQRETVITATKLACANQLTWFLHIISHIYPQVLSGNIYYPKYKSQKVKKKNLPISKTTKVLALKLSSCAKTQLVILYRLTWDAEGI